MKEELTNKQLEVYSCIKEFINSNGYSPSIRELCKMMKLSSPATMHSHLKQLVKKGYIGYKPQASRTIRIIKEIYQFR